MLEYLIIAFVAGIAVKASDWLEDDLKTKSPVRYILGIGYGILLGFLISRASFSSLFLAALVAQVFAGKIDELAHRLGLGIAIISTFFFGVPTLEFIPFGFFLILAFFDEVNFVGALKPLSDNRLFLVLGTLPFLALGRWDFTAGILAFDLGYLLFTFASKKLYTQEAKTEAKTLLG